MSDRFSRRVLVASVWLMLFVTTGSAAEMKVQRIRVDSTPAGAEVSTIVGRRGVTPLSITERDIYPNTYPEAKLNLYGKVIISKPGCQTVTRTITLGDVKNGLDIQLDCTAPAPVSSSKTVEPAPISKPALAPDVRKPALPATAPVSESLSARRLRQLQVLDELLDDGLISSAEERAIRKRIFDRLDQN